MPSLSELSIIQKGQASRLEFNWLLVVIQTSITYNPGENGSEVTSSGSSLTDPFTPPTAIKQGYLIDFE